MKGLHQKRVHEVVVGKSCSWTLNGDRSISDSADRVSYGTTDGLILVVAATKKGNPIVNQMGSRKQDSTAWL